MTVHPANGVHVHSAATQEAKREIATEAGLTVVPHRVTTVDVVIPIRPSLDGGFTASQVIEFAVHNTSEWLDLCPVLSAKKSTTDNNWNVCFRVGRKEVTQTMTSENGLAFLRDLRLWPGVTRVVQMFLSCKNPTAEANQTPMEVQVSLMPHPGYMNQLNHLLVFRIQLARE
jgi:hypothetical protein